MVTDTSKNIREVDFLFHMKCCIASMGNLQQHEGSPFAPSFKNMRMCSNDRLSAWENILWLRINLFEIPRHYENCKIITWLQKVFL